MENGHGCSLSIAERLAMLKNYQKSWLSLAWSEEQSLTTRRSRVWEIAGGAWGSSTGDASLSFTQLPSVSRGIPFRQWSIKDVGFSIRDFCMDPSQDLLTALELPTSDGGPYILHLLSLSSGTPHPMSRAPSVLYLHSGETVLASSFSIQICGPLVGVLLFFTTRVTELLIHDWYRLQLHMDIGVISHYPKFMDSFAFLKSDLILVCSFVDSDGSNTFQPTLQVFKCTPEDSVRDPEPLCSFGLPSLAEGAEYAQIIIRADPSPAYRPEANTSVPFYTGQSQRLFIISSQIARRQDIASQTFFVPARTFLHHIDQIHVPGTHHFIWERWGPSGCRLLDIRTDGTWESYVYGSRFVHMVGNPGVGLVVLDFNQLTVQRFASRNLLRDSSRAQAGKYGVVLDSCTAHKDANLFQDDVTTSLPHVVSSRFFGPGQEGSHAVAAMIAEDGVIIVDKGGQEIRHHQILVF
ncbi:hypothetical protein JAAARDRAFT_27918 [Jaapia argillacea MUCL 33604]|uniref:Uncharacterized protein n=1 Tax=Jaapia argillacea MUCL 33604 TaxID=933084 RepID=A0A067QB52_9AGAM|nr:hypothetical protein JAAARDRAFT_27918 [Jaapia argillacea MUCL 33604]